MSTSSFDLGDPRSGQQLVDGRSRARRRGCSSSRQSGTSHLQLRVAGGGFGASAGGRALPVPRTATGLRRTLRECGALLRRRARWTRSGSSALCAHGQGVPYLPVAAKRAGERGRERGFFGAPRIPSGGVRLLRLPRGHSRPTRPRLGAAGRSPPRTVLQANDGGWGSPVSRLCYALAMSTIRAAVGIGLGVLVRPSRRARNRPAEQAPAAVVVTSWPWDEPWRHPPRRRSSVEDYFVLTSPRPSRAAWRATVLRGDTCTSGAGGSSRGNLLRPFAPVHAVVSRCGRPMKWVTTHRPARAGASV